MKLNGISHPRFILLFFHACSSTADHWNVLLDSIRRSLPHFAFQVEFRVYVVLSSFSIFVVYGHQNPHLFHRNIWHFYFIVWIFLYLVVGGNKMHLVTHSKILYTLPLKNSFTLTMRIGGKRNCKQDEWEAKVGRSYFTWYDFCSILQNIHLQFIL